MENLNKYLSNFLVGYVKLHALHWNVEGLQFKLVHEYTEELYKTFSKKYDDVAELQKQMRQSPLAKVKDYLEASDIQECGVKSISTKDAIAEALDLVKSQRELAETIRSECGENDYPISNMMEDHIEEFDQIIWFMESMLK